MVKNPLMCVQNDKRTYEGEPVKQPFGFSVVSFYSITVGVEKAQESLAESISCINCLQEISYGLVDIVSLL